MNSINFSDSFLSEIKKVVDKLNIEDLDSVINVICDIKKDRGRIFFCGSGGGAGHASHAAADFRKLINIESYSVTDNVSELTAQINDNSWSSSYKSILKSSNFSNKDCLFVFSVGGGSVEPPISNQIVKAIDYVLEVKGKILGIVGRDGGYTRKKGTASILIPTISDSLVTAHTEGMQAYLWHLIVSHPKLSPNIPKWESVK